MHTNSIGLIVIDSVAGIYRLESDAITRAGSMRKLVRKLQSLADEYECAVVCVNQVWNSIPLNFSFNLKKELVNLLCIVLGNSFNEQSNTR